MKKKTKLCAFGGAVLLSAAFLSSCDRLGEHSVSGFGMLKISFIEGGELYTKAYPDVPDTADFLLEITDASGRVIYDGLYGDCKETMELSPGSYNVRVISAEFEKPAFDKPQFGDEQCVIVPENGIGKAVLSCRQMNAGIRLDVSPDFLEECPDASLFLKSDKGKLMYSYSEKRIAYFAAGPISVVMNSGGIDKVLMVRELAASEILTLGISVSSSSQDSGCSVSVAVDTSRIWTKDSYVIGGNNSGNEIGDPLSVAEARSAVGKSDVWVCGYVVGGDLSSSSFSFVQPFKSRTNIMLGPRSSTSDRNACLSVQLPDGEVRENLNLVDNPGILGKRICVKGDIVDAYFGMTGVKNVKEFMIY